MTRPPEAVFSDLVRALGATMLTHQRAGISRATLTTRWEHGIAPTVDTLARIVLSHPERERVLHMMVAAFARYLEARLEVEENRPHGRRPEDDHE